MGSPKDMRAAAASRACDAFVNFRSKGTGDPRATLIVAWTTISP